MDLRANTAVDVLIGPFVDKTDGNTTEDALTLTAAEIKLSKNGQALALKSDVTSATFDDDGYYNCELDATDVNTEGNLVLIVHQSANALPVRHEFNVLSEAAWDSLYAAKDTGFMDVNVKEFNAVSTSAVTTVKAVQGLAVDGVITTLTNLPAITADWLTAAGTAADFTTEIQTGLATSAVCSEARLAELDAANLPTDIAAIPITAMRGTDGANTTVPDAAGTKVTLADGVTHGGTTALLRLGSSSTTPAFFVTNSGGDAVHYEATGASGNGFHSESAGTGGGSGVAAVHYEATGAGTDCLIFNGEDDAAAFDTTGRFTGSVANVLGGINTTAGTITTLDALDTAQDTQHSTTQSSIATAQLDLDKITGADGVTLATAQALYAPNVVVPDAAGTAATLHGVTDTAIAAVQTVVDTLATPADILTTQLTEAYAANGVEPTLVEAIMAIHQKLMQTTYTGTSSTTRKLDNATTAFVGTLDDDTNPTEDRRA